MNGGSAISVNGGRCSGPIQVRDGWRRTSPFSRGRLRHRSRRRSRYAERQARQHRPVRQQGCRRRSRREHRRQRDACHVRQSARRRQLRRPQDLQADRDARLRREVFSFKVNGGSAISVEAGDAYEISAYSCRLAGHFQVGTKSPCRSSSRPRRRSPGSTPIRPTGWPTSAPLRYAVVTIGTGMTDRVLRQRGAPSAGQRLARGLQGPRAARLRPVRLGVQGSFHFTITDQLRRDLRARRARRSVLGADRGRRGYRDGHRGQRNDRARRRLDAS